MYRLVVSISARNQIKKLKQVYQQAIVSALEDIKEDPYLGKPLTRELSGRFSYRIGIYRIIYKVNFKEKIVLIITAGHRSVVYN